MEIQLNMLFNKNNNKTFFTFIYRQWNYGIGMWTIQSLQLFGTNFEQ